VNCKLLAAVGVGLLILYGIFTWMASRQTKPPGTSGVSPDHEGAPESSQGKRNSGRRGEASRPELKFRARVKELIANAWNGLHSQYVTIVLLITIPIVFVVAKGTGDDLAVQMRMGRYVKPIKFFFKDGAATRYPEDFVRSNEKEALKLLIETTHSFYVLDQSIGEEKELPSGFTYAVSKDDIDLARVWLVNVPKPGGVK
jgi:hypothetical protein